MTRTKILTIIVLQVAVSSSVHNSLLWKPSKGMPPPRPPTIIHPIVLPPTSAHSTLSPELLNLLQNSQSNPPSSPPPTSIPADINRLPGTTSTNPLSAIPPSVLNQISSLFNGLIPTQPRQPQDGNSPSLESNIGHSSTIPLSSILAFGQPSSITNDKDPYPPESFPAPPIPQTYSPIRTGSAAAVVPSPPEPFRPSPPATAPLPYASSFPGSTLLPIQPLNLSPALSQELMTFLSSAGVQPSTNSPSKDPIKNKKSNQIVVQSSDDDNDDNDDDDDADDNDDDDGLSSDTHSPPSPLAPSLSTLPTLTDSKQSPASDLSGANPLLNLLLNSQSSINLLNSFLSLAASGNPTTTAQPPIIKRSLNPSFIKYLSTLPRFQQTSDQTSQY